MERSEGWGETGRLVLGFDARCPRCVGLAGRIRRCVGDRLEVGDLRSARARRWRERALGQDAPWVPTLFEVRGRRVRAWVGIEMGLVLAHRLGAADGLRILRALGETRAAGESAGDGARSPVRLRLVGEPVSETVRGATLALSTLAGAPTDAASPECSQAQRRVAGRILRGSREYRAMTNALGAELDLRRAAYVSGGEVDVAGVVATGTRDSIRVFAAYLVDLRRGSLDTHWHLTVTESDGERVFVDYRDREPGKSLIVGDDYVVLPDGRWVTPEEFRGRSRGDERDRREVEGDVVYGEDSRSGCLRRSYAFCMRVAEYYRAS